MPVRAANPSCEPGEHGESRPVLTAEPRALERASRIFRALGEPPRLRLIALL